MIDEQDVDNSSGVSDEVELFGSMEIRWYQIAARNMCEELFEQNPKARVLVVAPTGSGKTLTNGTILLSDRVRRALGKPGMPLRVLFVSHAHRLLTQAERAYEEELGFRTVTEKNAKSSYMWANAAERLSGVPSHTTEVFYQSAFSSIPDNLEFDLVVIDETHHESMTTIQMKLDVLGGHPFLGLTATPDRPDHCLLKFDKTVCPLTRQQAVDEGYLAPAHLHDFVDLTHSTKFYQSVLENYAPQMGQTIIFARTKVEVAIYNTLLTNLGYNSVALLDQRPAEIDKVLDRFSAGEHQFIINCARLREGVDVKGCTDVVLFRQFGSLVALNQVIGRASRPDSDCNVWSMVDPLSTRNHDATAIVGIPETRRLISYERGHWNEYHMLSHQYTTV